MTSKKSGNLSLQSHIKYFFFSFDSETTFLRKMVVCSVKGCTDRGNKRCTNQKKCRKHCDLDEEFCLPHSQLPKDKSDKVKNKPILQPTSIDGLTRNLAESQITESAILSKSSKFRLTNSSCIFLISNIPDSKEKEEEKDLEDQPTQELVDWLKSHRISSCLSTLVVR